MVNPAQRDHELVTHLARHSLRLSEPQMVRIGGQPRTDETRLRPDELQMLFTTVADGLRDRHPPVVFAGVD